MDGRLVVTAPGALMLVFLAWTAGVAGGWLDPLDAVVGPGLVDAGNADAWLAVSAVGEKAAMAALLVVAVGVAFWRRDRVGVFLAGALPVAGWGVGSALKWAVDRPRPDWAVAVEESAAYPSNHALTGMLLWVCVVYVLARHHPRRVAMAAAGAVPALVISYSRLSLGVHHVSDLVGGWLLALAMLAALPALTARLDERWPRPRGTSPPAPDGA